MQFRRWDLFWNNDPCLIACLYMTPGQSLPALCVLAEPFWGFTCTHLQLGPWRQQLLPDQLATGGNPALIHQWWKHCTYPSMASNGKIPMFLRTFDLDVTGGIMSPSKDNSYIFVRFNIIIYWSLSHELYGTAGPTVMGPISVATHNITCIIYKTKRQCTILTQLFHVASSVDRAVSSCGLPEVVSGWSNEDVPGCQQLPCHSSWCIFHGKMHEIHIWTSHTQPQYS